MNKPLLILEDLRCQRGDQTLFDGLNLRLEAGACTELRGPNGSGKSTLLRAAAGLFPHWQGRIEAAPCLYLGHKPGISALLSVRENLDWYQRMARQRTDAPSALAATVAEALERVGLAALAAAPCAALSQGQQRRLSLARTLLFSEPLWLLDEPLTALDAEGRGLARQFLIEHCARGGAALCATHQSLGWDQATALALG